MNRGLEILLAVSCGMAASLTPSMLAADATEPPLLMESPNTFRGHPPPKEGRSGWLGLYVGSHRSRLAPARVRVVREDNGEFGDVWALQALVKTQPLMLFKPQIGLHAGKVETLIPQQRAIGIEESIDLRLRAAHWTLAWRCEPATARLSRCVLEASDVTTKQQLAERTQDPDDVASLGPVSLIWAGDLDGDGRPDILLVQDRGDVEPLTRLWLSSKAVDGELLHAVAEYEPQDLC